jgi:hypothetical protein
MSVGLRAGAATDIEVEKALPSNARKFAIDQRATTVSHLLKNP